MSNHFLNSENKGITTSSTPVLSSKLNLIYNKCVALIKNYKDNWQMSKRKSELEDRIEELEAEIEELRSTNKALIRRLRKIDSKFVEDDYLDETEVEKKYEHLKQYICPYCKKQSMEEVEIAGRTFKRCDNCGKRTKAEKA